MKIIDSFTTSRVKARKMTQGDLEDLASMAQNEQVMATLGGIQDRSQVLQSMEKNIGHWDKYGFAYWILEDADTGAFMGRAGLLHTHIDGADEVELGYALLPEYWGRGIATEVAQEIIRIGFEQLGLESIVGFTLPDNVASQKVLQKAGLEFEKNCEYKGFPHVFYRLTKEQFENR